MVPASREHTTIQPGAITRSHESRRRSLSLNGEVERSLIAVASPINQKRVGVNRAPLIPLTTCASKHEQINYVSTYKGFHGTAARVIAATTIIWRFCRVGRLKRQTLSATRNGSSDPPDRGVCSQRGHRRTGPRLRHSLPDEPPHGTLADPTTPALPGPSPARSGALLPVDILRRHRLNRPGSRREPMRRVERSDDAIEPCTR